MTRQRRRPATRPAAAAEPRCIEIPARCPRPGCGSTNRSKRESVTRRKVRGVTRDGEPFDQMRTAYVNCRDCGQRYVVKSFHLAGD